MITKQSLRTAIPERSPPPPGGKGACKFFAQFGNCRQGANCPFQHVTTGQGGGNTGGQGRSSTRGQGRCSTGGQGGRSAGGQGGDRTGGQGGSNTGGQGGSSTVGQGGRSTRGLGRTNTGGPGDSSTGGQGGNSNSTGQQWRSNTGGRGRSHTGEQGGSSTGGQGGRSTIGLGRSNTGGQGDSNTGGQGRSYTGGQKTCNFFMQTGHCKKGTNCPFRHVAGKSVYDDNNYNSTGVGDRQKFIRQLRQSRPDHVVRLIKDATHFWHQCWMDVSKYAAVGELTDWVTVLAKIPVSADVVPPPLSAFKSAMVKYMKVLPDQDAAAVLGAAEISLNVVKRMLEFVWDEDKSEVKGVLLDVLDASSKHLQRRDKDHRDALTRTDKLMDELEKDWKIKQKTQHTTNSDSFYGGKSPVRILDHTGWRDATVQWLCNSPLFTPAQLPKMQVPNTDSKGVYRNRGHYFDTMLRLMVGMTFAEGHAAVSPRCCEKECGNVLSPVGSGNATNYARCRGRGCNNTVTLTCKIPRHNQGLCTRCAELEQEKILGPRGTHASTHIYDCRVHKSDVTGKLYSTGVTSRRPPTERSIHWKTTKRLACPNLVGVVKLGSKACTSDAIRGRGLKLSDKIIWGEFVSHGMPNDEFIEREKGRVCINMNSLNESFDPEVFAENDVLAIIDCMAFVPEYIPVLRALELQETETLPFDDGALLNLDSARPADMNNTIMADENVAEFLNALDGSCVLERSTIEQLVWRMIDNSTLQPIREIRQDDSLSSRLASKITSLIKETTLDKGQLVNFIDSLLNPVHLTQGPPGTGKSYLGVVIVRALICIRQLWMEKNPSVGMPPILVLSYKNHATDEFLTDLVKAEQLKPPNSYSRHGARQDLVRMGNSDDPTLAPFTERFLANKSDPEVQYCTKFLHDLHDLRRSCMNAAKTAILFRGYQSEIMGEEDKHVNEDPKALRMRQNATAYEATEVLFAAIVRAWHLTGKFQATLDLDDSTPTGDFDENVDLRHTMGFMSLDRDSNHRCRNLARTISDSEMKEQLEKLCAAVQHYIDFDKDYDDPHEILYMFLNGTVPLPCCMYHSTKMGWGCRQLALCAEVHLCQQHRCHLPVQGCVNGRCDAPISPEKMYLCEHHACCSQGCENPRVFLGDDRQIVFCKDHACFKCIELKCHPVMEAYDEPPVNVCRDHYLCCVDGCRELGYKGDDYCHYHQRYVSCKYLYSNRNRNGRVVNTWYCAERPLSSDIPYCKDHVDEMMGNMRLIQEPFEQQIDPELQAAIKRNEKRKCAGKNKKNNPCGSWAAPGSDFCHAHDRQDASYKEHKEQEGTKEDTKKSEEGIKKLGEDKAYSSKNSEIDGFKTPEEHQSEADEAKSQISENFGPPPDIYFKDGGAYDNIDEVEETDGMQHLRDVYEVSEPADSVSVYDVEDSIPPNSVDLLDASSDWAAQKTLILPNCWHWNMSLDERWDACQQFMLNQVEAIERILAIIKRQIQCARKDLQKASIRAKARVYEDKSIIGGTIVGCISRLEAIRATRPFAIVVEEASEVLEPLLFACMCSSTVKFQMIGDHLQLQPNLMDKFEFMRINKVSVSMFERLIRAPAEHQVPNGVLSVQRRMRKDICDLTRDYYRDIVKIEDHKVCSTKKLPGNVAHKTFWKGREVPGIRSHIFLWTHSGEQTKAEVGLSKINKHEASLSVHLAYYLVSCGVERRSIAILTPYKGQLMFMRKLLLKNNSNSRLLTFDHKEKNQIRLSTVDRFQGDEADIVIISLVVDENSRTPFVKLVNRMIVLLSRARLGMYILGNVGYFEGRNAASVDVKHWMNTFELLQHSPKESDNSALEFVDEPVFSTPAITPVEQLRLADAKTLGPRVGSKLLLCCPQHPINPDSCIEVENESGLKLGYCKVACEATLACSHTCGLSCHFPHKQHNKNCVVEVDSPCLKHPEKLTCSHIYKHAPGVMNGHDSLDVAIEAFECPVEVTVTLPCNHAEKMPCSSENAIIEGRETYPECNRKSPNPYVYSECGHCLEVTCAQKEKYRKHPSTVKTCANAVSYTPEECDHIRQVKCYLARQYARKELIFTCPERLSITLPRCKHEAQVSCAEHIRISKWYPEPNLQCCNDNEPGVVREGIKYANQDSVCSKKATFLRLCGHEQSMGCEEAFVIAATMPGPCKETVKFINPYCGHVCNVSCADAQKANKIGLVASVDYAEVLEGTFPPFPTGLPVSMTHCNKEVTLSRMCGHNEKMSCTSARRNPGKCKRKIEVISPLCGHMISMPCHLQVVWQIWPTNVEKQLQEKSILMAGAQPITPSLPDKEVLACFQNCKKQVVVTKKCGHTYNENCCELTQIVQDGGMVKKGVNCSETVTRALRECGHEITVICKTWQQYQDSQISLTCDESVVKPCWNANICGVQALTVPCSKSNAVICCPSKVSWKCKSGRHSHKLELCRQGNPLTCPNCEMDVLNEILKETEETDHESIYSPHVPNGIRNWRFLETIFRMNPGRRIDDVMSEILKYLGASNVTALKPNKNVIKGFRAARQSRLKKFEIIRVKGGIDEFAKQRFEPNLLPVFFVVSSHDHKLAAEQKRGFQQLKNFIKINTLQGIQLYIPTPENIRALATEMKGSVSRTLLCGYIYTLRAVSGCTWPSKKTTQNFLRNYREAGYDCVEFQASNETLLKRLIAWEPYPLYATHYAGPLSYSQLTDWADQIAANSTNLNHLNIFQPSSTEFSGVGDGSLEIVFGKGTIGPASIDTGSTAKGESTCRIAALSGTWAETLDFVCWETCENQGDDDVLHLEKDPSCADMSLNLQGDLMNKLSFINKHAGPFAGKNLLEKLLGTTNDKSPSLISLLWVLEIAFKDDQDRAKEKLKDYCECVQKAGTKCVHPLLLLAFARLGCPELPRRGNELERAPSEAELLSVLARKYPEMTAIVCSAHEKNIIKQHLASSAEEADNEEISQRQSVADAADQWADLKTIENLRSAAMEELLKLTGLRKVKQAAVQLFKKGCVFARMDEETRQANVPTLNYVFLGNPGTGKTTVARLFAEILFDTGLRKAMNFKECSGQNIKDEGIDEFKKLAMNAMNGVLFIDEAYTLNPIEDKFKGAPIANEIVTLSENRREDLTIILAGYADDLNDKLFAYNRGLKSRFTEVLFEDFDEKELLEIWNHQRDIRKWRDANPLLGQVVVRRVAKMRGRKGFGNARDIRNKLEQACDLAMSRDDFDHEDMVLKMEDAVGENPTNNPKLDAVLQDINNMTGWTKVKQEIANLVKVCGENYERELMGQEPFPVFFNRMFLGNPGTGKTTCAKLYGKILKHLGFLSNGDVVEKTAGDLGGSHMGEAQQKTVVLLESCCGKVLLIDEAYGLNDGYYGKQVLNTLVEKVQGTEADDIAVLLLGYEDDMLKMINEQNPGLRRRFAPEQAFYFEDYTDQQLEQILQEHCKRKNYKPSLEFREKALKKLKKQKRSETHFGNAGSVNNLLKAALAKASSLRSCSEDGVMRLEAEDIDLGFDQEDLDSALSELDKLYRMEPIKKKLLKLKTALDQEEEDGGEERPSAGHFVFTGAPGTGKTTVARALGKILFCCGLLSKPDVYETTGLNLTGEHVGQTKKKVEDELVKANGGILFIDEAYELGKGQYGSEACSALVGAITSNRYAGLVIVLAGYQANMQTMLDTNPGLKSRFDHFFEFPDWHPADCVHLLEQKAQSEKFLFDNPEAVRAVAEKGFSKLIQLKGWGNARDVTKVWNGAKDCRAQRIQGNKTVMEKVLTKEDVDFAMKDLVDSRLGTIGSSHTLDPNADPFAPLDNYYCMESVRKKLQQLKNAFELALKEGNDAPDLGHFVFSGAPGTGKTSVARVMADILFKLELLPRNNVVETSGLNLTGEYVGQTKMKVEQELDKAKGGILFIDEAYALAKSGNNNNFGAEAITTLVAAMTSPIYAGLTIIIAGYQAEISSMLEVNVGLKSRFKHFIEFPDWTPPDCVNLFMDFVAKHKFTCDADCLRKIMFPGFKMLSELKGWGNARDVTKLWEAVQQNRADRLCGETEVCKTLLPADVKTAVDQMVSSRLGNAASGKTPNSEDVFLALDKLYRMEKVKATLQQLQNTYVIAEREGEDPPPLGHFIFAGSPGTGKTTVARIMADILFNLGLIGRNHVEETSGLDLQGQYLGQTKVHVEERLNRAKGGVLFIDEAYNLGQGSFGKEACDTLVAAMTNPQYAGVVIVIAGYTHEINEMLQTNPGLKSRFVHTLEFPNWTAGDCVECFFRIAENKNLEVEDTGKSVLEDGFEKLSMLDGWANARDVDGVWKAAQRFRADRLIQDKSELAGMKMLLEVDIASGLNSLLKDRNVGSQKCLLQQKNKNSFGEPVYPPRVQFPEKPLFREDVRSRGDQAVVKTVVSEATNAVEKTAVPDATDAVGKNAVSEATNAVEKTAVSEATNAVENTVASEVHKKATEDPDCNDNFAETGAATRDQGVSDEVWAELQAVKAEEKRYEAEVREKEEEQKREEARLAEELRQIQLAKEAYEAKMSELQRAREKAEAKRRELERVQAKAEQERYEAELREKEEERKRQEARLAEELRQKQLAKEAHEAKMRELQRARQEAEAKRRQLEKVRAKLRQIGKCPVGFKWLQVSGGWRCEGGSHFVTDAELRKNFSYNV